MPENSPAKRWFDIEPPRTHDLEEILGKGGEIEEDIDRLRSTVEGPVRQGRLSVVLPLDETDGPLGRIDEAAQVFLQQSIPVLRNLISVRRIIRVESILLFPLVRHAVVVAISRGGCAFQIRPTATLMLIKQNVIGDANCLAASIPIGELLKGLLPQNRLTTGLSPH